MSKSLVWYEVVDLTTYAVKYPKDWYERSGRKYSMREASVLENLGNYSSMRNAVNRLRKWALDKGINYDENCSKFPDAYYYWDDSETECQCMMEVGIWYDLYDKQVTDPFERVYGTGAMIVKKTLELNKDKDP